jgi:hypothetical protein
VSTSSTAQYGARPGGVGVAGTLVGVGLAVGDGDDVMVGEGVGDGVGVGVAVLLGLAGAVVIVACGVDVAETGGGAHVSASDAARPMRRRAVNARRT